MPVLNEAALLPRALDSLERARAHLLRHVDCAVRIVVVDDGSSDGSAEIAEAHPHVEVIRAGHRGVGSSRASGASLLLRGARPEEVWIATTDGDSAVPSDWLVVHHRAARGGAEVLVGQIRPDPADLSQRQLRRWRAAHPATTAPLHIHGANLGIRGDAYLRSGGFEAITAHEDVQIVAALRRRGSRIVGTDQGAVLTSGRPQGRAPDGFSRYVREELRE